MRYLLPCIVCLPPLAVSTLLGVALPALAQSIIPAGDGTGTVVAPDGANYVITGGTSSGDGANLFHSFDQFGLTETEAANFIADPAIQNILGRIIGGDASIIDGLLQVSNSSANLYLINPAGILFGANATLNLDGSFTATTASGIEFGNSWLQSIGNNDYAALVGEPTAFGFTADTTGALVNAGQLAVDAGATLTLVGGAVVNTGTLSAPGGQIIIMAVPGENLVRIQPEGALLSLELETLPDTAGLSLPFSPLDIPALLQAGGPGMATSITVNDDGTVSLTGAETALPTSQGTTLVSGRLDVTGNTGGTAHILGEQIGVVAATIDASGSLGGGTLLVGGDYQGDGTVPTANLTLIDTDSVLRADALETGNGGEVIVWADKSTQFDGFISAQGGILSGDGGFVEVSGRNTLAFNGYVDVGAVNGSWGTLLLDPTDIIIDNNPSTPGLDASLPDIFAAESPGEVTLNADTLQNQTGNIVLEATNDIIVADGVALVFEPGGSITFTADADNDSAGDFVMENPADTIEALGRPLTITGASVTAGNIDVGDSANAGAGDVTITASTGALTVGNITTAANTAVVNAGSINLSAENGSITVGEINTFASITGFFSGTGGAVTISAGGAIDVASVEASSGGGDGSPVSITTTNGDITTGRLSASGQNQGGGSDITLSTDSGSIVTGDIFARTAQDRATDPLRNGGDISITATNGSITTGLLDAQSTGAGADGNGGNITLNSDEEILITGSIFANSNTQGGNVELASNSGITINGSDTLTLSTVGNDQDGLINFNSPSVTLTGDEIDLLSPITGTGNLFLQPTTADQDIVLGGLNDLGDTVLDLLSDELATIQDGFNSITIGQTNGAGTISLGGNVVFSDPVTLQTLGAIDTINGTLTGIDNASLNLEAGAGISTGPVNTNGTAVNIDGDTNQNGDGSVTVNAAITTDGGNITLKGASLTGAGISIPTGGSLDSGGGDITLQGNQVTLNTDINTDGDLAVIASDGDILTREITTAGGSIDLTASQGAIATQNLTTAGGAITLDAESSITADALDSSGATGGAITLQADDFIQVDSINAQGDTAGGSINIETSGTFQASSSFTNQAGIEASLSTLSLLGSDSLNSDPGGAISISHGEFSFTVGDPTVNGTLAAITTDDVVLLPAPNSPIDGRQTFGEGLPGEVQLLGVEITPADIPEVDRELDDNDVDIEPDIESDSDSSETSDIGESRLVSVEQNLLDNELDQRQEQAEESVNTEFTNFFGNSIKEARSVTTAEAKATLSSIQKRTGEVPAFMYVRFGARVNGNRVLELMLITANGSPIWVKVPTASRREVLKVQEQLRRQITNPNLTNNTAYLAPAQQLYDWIIAPIQPYLEQEGITNIGLIMDAGLRTLPVAVLHDGEQFLIEKYSLGLIPSLGLIDTSYVNLDAQTSNVLVGGASQFINQPPLLAANVEMKAIQKQWPRTRRLTGANFTVDAIKRERRQAQIIHLTTHAEFLRGAPDNSYLQFFDSQLRLTEVPQLEWYAPPVELVILSACQTAMGNAEAELGFAGFVLQAGAKSAMASLWKVSDEATAGLMLTFYQQLDQEMIKAEALREAQLAMIQGEIYTNNGQLVSPAGTETLPSELNWNGQQDFSHPFFWSAFTLVGSPW